MALTTGYRRPIGMPTSWAVLSASIPRSAQARIFRGWKMCSACCRRRSRRRCGNIRRRGNSTHPRTGRHSPCSTPFDNALANRYGAPTSLADYVAKAQLDNYDNVRAQFEAFNAHMDAAKPSTGVIYWMLNNAWPSLHWHLYDYYMNPAGAYFGAKKANEPVHIQYSYDSNEIVLVNHTLDDAHGLAGEASACAIWMAACATRSSSARASTSRGTTRDNWRHCRPWPACPRAYFVELELASVDGQPVSRNVYWLSTRADVLDWRHSNWYLTPVTQYADSDRAAILAGRDERRARNDAARRKRRRHHGHAVGARIVQDRGFVPACVDQAWLRTATSRCRSCGTTMTSRCGPASRST